MLRIAVVMDPLETIRPDHDTTYVIILEALARGHAVHHVAPAGVGYRDGMTILRGRRLHLTDEPNRLFDVDPFESLPGPAWDAVLIRTDPPFDADYLSVTQLLDFLPSRTFVMNRPAGLRDANEKLAALVFPDLCPPTRISQDPAELDEFRKAVGGDVVVKPLDGFGGRGVLLVRADDPNRPALLRAVTCNGRTKALAQAVVDRAERGDVRILLLDGKPIGAVLRRNDTGGFVHNLAAGGSAHKHALTDAEVAICERVGPWLRDQGLSFVGLDVIGGKLIEINVTSPTCVQEINRLDGVKLEREIVDFVERQTSTRW